MEKFWKAILGIFLDRTLGQISEDFFNESPNEFPRKTLKEFLKSLWKIF